MLVLFHSFKGGVGVTTVVANLAMALSRFEQQVALADLTGQQSLTFHLGTEENTSDSAKVDTIADIDIPLLSASSIEELLSFSKEIDEDNGFILVDLGTENLELLEVLNENNQALVITILAPNAGCMALLPEAFDKTHCYILNAVEPRYDFQRAAAQFVQDMAEDNLIGTIRRDEALNEALGKLERLNIYAPASAALNDFDSIAQQILLMLGRQTMVKPKASAHVS